MRWKIGDVTITKIVEMEIVDEHAQLVPEATPEALKPIGWLYPAFVTEAHAARYSFHGLVVETPGALILVDTCFGSDKPRPDLGPIDRMQSRFLDEFKAAGFSPEDVDVVVCTHMHLDHVGWNTTLVDGEWRPTFPNARYLFGRREFDHWQSGMHENHMHQDLVMQDSVQPVIDAGLADFVAMDHQVCPQVRLRPAPGHTPGHVCVEIASGGERGLITGDTMHHPCQMARPQWGTPADGDAEGAFKTRAALLSELAGAATLVVGTHWCGPTAGHVVRDGEGYRLVCEELP